MKKIIMVLVVGCTIASLYASSGAYRQAAARGTQALRTQTQQQARRFTTNTANRSNALIVHPSQTEIGLWGRIKARAYQVEKASENYWSDLQKALFGAVAITAAGQAANDQFGTQKNRIMSSQGILDARSARMNIQTQATLERQERLERELSQLNKKLDQAIEEKDRLLIFLASPSSNMSPEAADELYQAAMHNVRFLQKQIKYVKEAL